MKYFLSVIAVILLNIYQTRCNNAWNIENQYSSWLRFSLRFPVTNKFYIMADLDERMFHFPTLQLAFFQRMYFGYAINKNFEVVMCHVYILSHTNTPSRNPSFSVPEIRPHQDFLYRHKLHEKISLQHRIRLDERFIRNSNRDGLQPGYRFVFRPRYQLAFNYRILKGNKQNALSLIVHDEILVHFGKTIKKNFDQQRIYAGFRYDFSRLTSLQIGYMHWWQQTQRDYEYYSRHILQINFLQVIDFRKKNKSASG
jgi:hypothetical protein